MLLEQASLLLAFSLMDEPLGCLCVVSKALPSPLHTHWVFLCLLLPGCPLIAPLGVGGS